MARPAARDDGSDSVFLDARHARTEARLYLRRDRTLPPRLSRAGRLQREQWQWQWRWRRWDSTHHYGKIQRRYELRDVRGNRHRHRALASFSKSRRNAAG